MAFEMRPLKGKDEDVMIHQLCPNTIGRVSGQCYHLWGHLRVYIWKLGGHRAELTSCAARASVVLPKISSEYGEAVVDYVFKS
ncbi:hypothetical protein VPNG_07029 [Cytospora leucostoma]|uniref:Uncharacterized protein n=1 Tax=Cytospora leucostoma TaxID=1230097 RepID=A0A423WN87_9PEZI|nr:hypothetical protein VPNG_07029 [Cytospora leucostoma]